MKVRVTASGVHLFDRVSGLNVLLDEIRVQPDSFARAPRHVSISLTNTCDLTCPYCFVPRSPEFLGRTRLCRWLDELDRSGCLGVGFGGGEPTLHPDIEDLCRYTALHTRLGLTLTTHGHRLDSRLAEALSRNVHFLRVSMDGVGSTYEALRGRPFLDFLRQLELIRAIAPFGINYVVNSRTFADLDSAVSLAAERGAVEFLLLPEVPSRAGGGIDLRTLQALKQWASSYHGELRLTINEATASGFPVCVPFPDENGLLAYAHIDAAGIVRRSSYNRSGVAIGTRGILEAIEILEKRPEEVVR
ncbi:MAG: radical SAM protein [Deltaproteobacteria bacterium RBG_13_61_14]|nr:MAG: radical SAM protein [Deltaproteobacteria bacterium RBG_13_61_14]